MRQPNEALRQSMNRILDRFSYVLEDQAEFGVNRKQNTGYVRISGIREEDLEECQSVMSDGYGTIRLQIDMLEDGSYEVTAKYQELP